MQKPIQVSVKGLKHVPSFKNSKMLSRGRLMTNPEIQGWMEKAIQSIESQLRSVIQTTEGVTPMGQLPRSLIALLLPLDDSRQWMPKIEITSVEVAKGEEGAVIEIHKLL